MKELTLQTEFFVGSLLPLDFQSLVIALAVAYPELVADLQMADVHLVEFSNAMRNGSPPIDYFSLEFRQRAVVITTLHDSNDFFILNEDTHHRRSRPAQVPKLVDQLIFRSLNVGRL